MIKTRCQKRLENHEYREAQRKRNSAWYQREGRNPDRLKRKAEQMRQYRNDPQKKLKQMARWALNRRIKNGSIVKQPCAFCGEPQAEAHHKDYSKPLIVVWLCRRCHLKEHSGY